MCNYLTSKLAGDTFTLGLSISYYPKNTTCKPQNTIIKVDDIALPQLRSQGKITANSKEGIISLKCDNLFGDKNQASRNMVVYLSSSDLVTGSNTILRGNIDNGVGFVLDLKNHQKELKLPSKFLLAAIRARRHHYGKQINQGLL